MTTLKREDIISAALEAGFMLSTGYGQGANKQMPISDTDTLMAFAEKVRSLPPASQEEIRNAALEDAAKVCDGANHFGNPLTTDGCAHLIRNMKSQPSAPACPDCQKPTPEGSIHTCSPQVAPHPAQSEEEQKVLAEQGVFKGAHGLRGLAEAQQFWDNQTYGTRLYYGDGVADYLHRDVLRAAVKALSSSQPPAAPEQITEQRQDYEAKLIIADFASFEIDTDEAIHRLRSIFAPSQPAGGTVTDDHDELLGDFVELVFQCARYERPSTDWREAGKKFIADLLQSAERGKDAEDAELERDAKRYRWLRMDGGWQDYICLSERGEGMDAAIDAAMSGKRGGE